jgi:hypothetical protein
LRCLFDDLDLVGSEVVEVVDEAVVGGFAFLAGEVDGTDGEGGTS